MSINELNAVEHFIIQKLSGVNLNAAGQASSVVKEDEAVYGSYPWQYRSAAELSRPTDQVLLEGELREALIRINPEITANPTALVPPNRKSTPNSPLVPPPRWPCSSLKPTSRRSEGRLFTHPIMLVTHHGFQLATFVHSLIAKRWSNRAAMNPLALPQ